MIYKKFTDLTEGRGLFKNFCEGKTWQEIYSTANADDLLWLFAIVCPDKKRQLVGCLGHVVNTIKHLMTDERSIKAVDGCIAYGKGEINAAELKIIADVDYDIYNGYATDAVVYITYIVKEKEWAYAYAAHAVIRTSYSGKITLKELSTIVREHIPIEDFELISMAEFRENRINKILK